MSTAIVTGATGILGREIVKELGSRPNEWSQIYALSRSKKEEFPGNVVQSHIDLCASTQEMAQEMKGIEAEYIFFAAYLEQSSEAENSKVNGDMFEAFLRALEINNSVSKIKRVILVCGAKQYGVQHGRVKIPMQETDPWLPEEEPFAPNFYYRQQRILQEFCARHTHISWVVTYPSEVIGIAKGNFMNFGTAVAVYAATQRELGESELVFPGAEDFYTRVTMFTDAQVHGQFCRWAALEPRAGNQAFNVVNGDAASWQDLFPRVANYFGLRVPDDQFMRPAPAPSERRLAAQTPLSLSAKAMGLSNLAGETSTIRQRIDLVQWSKKEEVQQAWKRLADRDGLDREALDRASWAFAGFAWGRDYDVVLSMTRARKLGWTGYADSWDSFETVFGQLKDARVIPK
ncbi:nad dependent epimerase dehydratase family protein [Colletotrichum truncatum]|uniref:Nad dependent epimerase dehydratase family protein n=1 Tax=Colletotrichum truncatum TaxID=5467 RepID=A0ACC3YPC1_COLTU|nr:nad dependent epimerase dehydratase family protein [Colletotrichum truncatum]KAF6784231.1 nad dependent epimerase dehydratase family protein [Colletotrichum truncatum]